MDCREIRRDRVGIQLRKLDYSTVVINQDLKIIQITNTKGLLLQFIKNR